jgi:hypothetical protein
MVVSMTCEVMVLAQFRSQRWRLILDALEGERYLVGVKVRVVERHRPPC